MIIINIYDDSINKGHVETINVILPSRIAYWYIIMMYSVLLSSPMFLVAFHNPRFGHSIYTHTNKHVTDLHYYNDILTRMANKNS